MHPLTDPTAAAALSAEQWVALHVPRFAGVVPAYVEYENYLKLVLKKMTNKVAPMAVVEARAKGVPSFAEKILRKRGIYQTPGDPQPPIRYCSSRSCGGRTAVDVFWRMG